MTRCYLDVSSLACPEPLESILERLHHLKPGEFLHVTIKRNPTLLYPILEKRGFDCMCCEEEDSRCEMLIWRRGDHTAESEARLFAATLMPA